MITLTNAQAVAFSSPIMSALFNDKDRQFPTVDAFKLSDLFMQVETRVQAYRQKQRELIESNNGIIEKSGRVTYPTQGDELIVASELAKLNAVELEYNGSKLTMSDDWPNLSLAEATILRPLINFKIESQEDNVCQTKPQQKIDE